jgi:hypothetical protein
VPNEETGAQLREEVATEAFLDHVTDPVRRERCREIIPTHRHLRLADWAAFTAIGLAYPLPEPTVPDRIPPSG